MLDKVKELIEYHSESYLLDFKREQYILGANQKKHELLKDISSMANHPSNEDKYIIVGVIEKDGVANSYHTLENIEDEAKYQEYLKSNVEPEINFEYKTFLHNDFKLAYFRIFDNDNRPYLFKNEIIENNKVRYHKGAMVIRKGTKIGRIDRADLDKIYEAKYSQKDRKPDVKLFCTVKNGFVEYSSVKCNVKLLVLSIENISNKSISFLVDFKVEKNSSFDIETAYDIQHKIRDYEKVNRSSSHYFGNYIQQPLLNWDAIKIVNSNEYKTVSRIKNSNHEIEIIIPQKTTKEDVFESDLILIPKEPKALINIEVKLSGDDFTSGPLIEKFSLEIDE